jgi:alpha-glucosidase
MFALPGSAYIYEGEELGLPEHTTLPATVRQDPSFFRTNGAEAGRDGCRVPLPWRSDAPGLGFGSTGATWLPQPEAFAELAVNLQEGVAGSTLEFYREAIAQRARLGLGRGRLSWNTVGAELLDLRNEGIRVLVNFGKAPLELPAGSHVLLESEARAVADGHLAADTAVWLQ